MTRPPAVDRATLHDLLETTGNDPAFLAELIDTYLVDASALLESMRQAIASSDTEQLRRAAHSLKSNSASLGAGALSGMCQELEQQARQGVLEGAAGRLMHLEKAYVDVERELRALRPGELDER
jgi:HPt (histidine-containing phosphotransfer) domain-containing protein